jgi:hypothetical protein
MASLSIVWLIGALAALASSGLRFFPAVALATLLSDDHTLTPVYMAYLQSAQWTFSILALALWPLTLVAPRLRRTVHFILHDLPDAVFLPASAALSFGATLGVQTFLFQGIPHVTDAISHLFQAKIFALGKLWTLAPPCFEHFLQFNISFTANGHWLTVYPPGHALTLLPALKLHLLPLYGPICTAISLLACAWLVQRFFGRPLARAFALLFLLSPMTLLIGGSYMSHISLLLCVSTALVLGIHGIDRVSARRPAFAFFAGAGFLMGMGAMIRPQDVVLLVPPILIGALWGYRTLVPALRCAIPGILAGLILPVAILLFWNHHVFGSAFALGYGRTDIGSLTRGAVPVFGLTDTFTLRDAVVQLVWTLSRLDSALLGWPMSLPFIGLAFLRRSQDRRDVLCLAAIGLVIAFYFTYDYYAREYEARFYAAFIPFLVVLVLRGLQRLDSWLPARAAVPMLGLLLTLQAFAFYWPRTIVPNYGRDYEQASPVVDRLARQAGLSKALVLIDASGSNDFRYSSGFIYNDPLLTNEVIYALDLPGKIGCLFDAFPDRTIYRFLPNGDWTAGRFEPVARE